MLPFAAALKALRKMHLTAFDAFKGIAETARSTRGRTALQQREDALPALNVANSIAA